MYEDFYGLREKPFDLALNPRQLLLTAQHREALANLEHGISSRIGMTVLVGEAGTGKTSVIRAAFARAEADAPGSSSYWAYLRNPTLKRHEFLEFLTTQFRLPVEAAASKAKLIEALEQRLHYGLRAVLIVDEAQSVPLELLEEVRLLANIEADSHKLLPVVLAGQPELADRLNEPALRQLKQRVALRCTLGPLTLRETAAYIVARIESAGGKPARLFSKEAVLAVHEHSGGIPRTINVICENALLNGYADEARPVGREIIDVVCRDFDLRGAGSRRDMSDAAAVLPTPVMMAPAREVAVDVAREAVADESPRRWSLRRR